MPAIARLVPVLLAACLIPAARADDPKPITVESLLDRLSDPSWLAEPPGPGERSFQFSSYDRATKLVDGEIVAPFANNDRGHYLRVEGEGDREEWVLADAEGPGYVSRIWSANPDGELRVYIDGATEPALAAEFAAITDGKVEPFSAPFGHDASRGRNLYFPFPFAKSIKITTTRGDQYYQVNVTTYAPGTAVESYSPDVLKRADGAIAEARRKLTAPVVPAANPSGTAFASMSGSGSGTLDFPEIPGDPGRRIASIQAKLDRDGLDDDDAADVLARTLLTIAFDGAAEPQVAVPLGDFFGSGPGLNPFHTAITEVKKDGSMIARWPMPFRRSARVSVHRVDGRPANLSVAAVVVPDPAAAEELTFHARWLQRDDVQTVKADGTLDWPALRVSGAAGRFVGLQCNLFNPTPAWWGEGDEKIHVDGEAFPSTFGTGTEDYFGYAWCDPTPFMSPFHAQTRCDGPGNKGNTSVLRLQTLDSIPFAKSLAFDLELWHWEAVKVQYATLAYVYAAPGAKVEPAGVPELSGRVVHPKPPILREPGAIEAESLRIRGKTAGNTENQAMGNFGDAWSGASQLFWIVQEPGARLDLELPAEKSGRHEVWAGFTKARDYGVARFTLNGTPLGDSIDLYDPNVVHSGAVRLGEADLKAGANVLGIEIAGKNDKSVGRLVGVDWIKLVPVAR